LREIAIRNILEKTLQGNLGRQMFSLSSTIGSSLFWVCGEPSCALHSEWWK